MKVVVLTANPAGIASRFLARRPPPPGVDFVGVLLDERAAPSRRSLLRRWLRKLRRSGPTALPVGLALRRVYAAAGPAVPIETLGVPVYRVPSLNGEEARARLRELRADICVSLDNRLLRRETFSLPRFGTVNVHHGAVPDFRGGPPVFWELREERATVGFTVHAIDAGVDTGPVFAAGEVPIRRRATLAETLVATIPALHDASLDALGSVLTRLAEGALAPQPQPAGSARYRTTPGLRDYLHVRRALRLSHRA